MSEIPQLAVASAKQTETQASAVVGETLSGNFYFISEIETDVIFNV